MRVKAKVCWLRKDQGGREDPPPGPKYSTVARFEDEKDKYPGEAWSLVLEFSDPIDEARCHIAEVRLLNPAGPTRLLHPGSVFELYEGSRLIARGEVLTGE